MKLIISHLASDAFDAVRTNLCDLGVHTTTITEVRTSGLEPAVTLRYRGAPLQTRLRPSLKLECVVSDEQSPAVVQLLRAHIGGAGTVAPRVAVLDLEEVYEAPADIQVFPDDPRLDAALH